MRREHLIAAFKIMAFVLVYYMTAAIGFRLFSIGGIVAIVWPPTGIAMAALMILGWRYFPAVFLASFCLNYWLGELLLGGLVIALGNTLEALLGYFLLVKVIRINQNLERLRDVIAFVLLGAVASTLALI